MAQPLPPNVPASLAGLLRRDGEWLRCAEPHCGDRAFWGVFRDGAFLRVKVAAHRAKMHNGAAPRPAAGRPQRRNVAAPAHADVLVNVEALAALQGPALGRGVARKGLDCPVVKKVALAGQQRHNLAEWHSYMSAPAEMRKWLCTPLMCAADGSWLIVRKADRVGNVAHEDHVAVRRALQPHGVFDLHLMNVGYLDGQPVATDYGQGMDGVTIKWARP